MLFLVCRGSHLGDSAPLPEAVHALGVSPQRPLFSRYCATFVASPLKQVLLLFRPSEKLSMG